MNERSFKMGGLGGLVPTNILIARYLSSTQCIPLIAVPFLRVSILFLPCCTRSGTCFYPSAVIRLSRCAHDALRATPMSGRVRFNASHGVSIDRPRRFFLLMSVSWSSLRHTGRDAINVRIVSGSSSLMSGPSSGRPCRIPLVPVSLQKVNVRVSSCPAGQHSLLESTT